MKRNLFLLFILYSLFVVSPILAAAGSQTWKVRPGDTLDIIATTLEIPKEEIKNHNPGVLESNLQIGQKLKLPLRPYLESKTLEARTGQKRSRIGKLERKSSDLEKQIASAESQLRVASLLALGILDLFRNYCIHSFRRILDFSPNAPAGF